MARLADRGISIGLFPPGPTGTVVDVPGVGVGHVTITRDEPPPPQGRGIARTGVTVLDLSPSPWASPVTAGASVLNGAGECTGLLGAREWGLIESPVGLTSTMAVGRVYDAMVEALVDDDPRVGVDDVVIPVVAECDDSFLSDPRRVNVEHDDVRAALAAAREGIGGPACGEGALGAGTGMSCFGWKGGVGSASRVVPTGHTVGVLSLTNFGDAERLTVDGVPVGRSLTPPAGPSHPPAGSCVVVVVTDAPIDAAACQRLARRAGLGLARTGSTAHHGSGEIFLALAIGLRAPRGEARPGPEITGRELDPLFGAVVEAVEESVISCLLAARTVTGRDGNTSTQLPEEQLRRLLAEHGRG